MSLWDLIRDFFVQHVFGGTTYDGFSYDFNIGGGLFTSDLLFTINGGQNEVYLSIGDWLSTTATIISITIIVVLCAMFIYKIVKLVGGLIR